MNAKKLMVAAAVGASALGAMANVIYVAPDGAGSGTSWSDPAPITTAIAAAVAAEGGEVWLKQGWYDLKAAIPLSTNVIVRGGFAGDETSADEADPKAHPTILSGIVKDANYGWTKNGSRNYDDPLWKDGEFNLCRPNDEDVVWRLPGLSNSSMGFSNFFTMPAGSTCVKIVGVTFTGCRGAAIVVSASSVAEVESCRFLACGVQTGLPTSGGVNASGLVTVKDCEFIGCGCPLSLAGSDTTVSHKVINCLFDDNTGCSGSIRAGAIDVTGTTPVEIEGCTFKGNIGLDRCSNSFAGSAIANYGGGAMTIKGCIFEDNRCRTRGTETPFGCICARKTVTIENCLFKGNSVKGKDLNYSQGRMACLCVMQGGSGSISLIVRNTVFAGNWISASSTIATTWGIVSCGSYTTGSFINCAFYDNEVSVEGTTDEARAGLWSTIFGMGRCQNGSDGSYGITLLNCLFSNNKLASNVTIPETGAPRQAEVMLLDENTKNPSFTYSIINTVIWNKSADHRCFREHPEINPWITHCDFVNCGDVEARTNGTTCIEYLTADDPHISPKVCRKRGTYPFKGMLGLALDSPFVKSGTPVYEKDGTFYIYEPELVAKKPWRHCTLKGTSYASLADGATPVADGFGVAREEDAFSYGPVVNVPFGLAVMLR